MFRTRKSRSSLLLPLQARPSLTSHAHVDATLLYERGKVRWEYERDTARMKEVQEQIRAYEAGEMESEPW
jgi:hypothetical protein